MNPEENKTTALVAVEGERLPVPKKASYWARISARYTLVWRILLVVLLLYSVMFILLFSRAFTYDSLFCFFKDLQTVNSFVPSDYNTVSATYEEGESTALSYRGGIAFVNTGGVEVYSPDGKRLLDVDVSFKSPRAVASRKYLVAFDCGGTAFSVTNSYTELFRGETDFPIYAAEVSDSGHFALITASNDVLSQVLLYDNNFNLIQRFQRASATVGVSVSDNGKQIALIGVAAITGTAKTVVDVYQLGKSTPDYFLSFEQEVPLSVGFTNNRHLTVLTDTALRSCDLDGKIENETVLDGTPISFTVGSEGAALVLETEKIDATHRVLVLDKRGALLYDGSFDRDVSTVAIGEDEAFLLSGNEVVRIDVDKQQQTAKAVENGATGLFVVDGGQVRVAYPAKVEYLSFKA
jgi:hypothetical protein